MVQACGHVGGGCGQRAFRRERGGAYVAGEIRSSVKLNRDSDSEIGKTDENKQKNFLKGAII